MNKYNIEYLKNNNLIVFECVAGSHSHGTNNQNSDLDKKGVFIMAKNDYYGLDYVEQVNDEKYDIVYYEIKKFIFLLLKSNPNALEMLASENENILYKNPIFDLLNIKSFLSKKCHEAFASYAYGQIKKSRGENKKIVQAMDEKKKNLYDFCYILKDDKSTAFSEWLNNSNIDPEYCGISRIDHAPDLYVLYYDDTKKIKYNGITSHNSTSLKLSSIPKNQVNNLKTLFYYNEDGFKTYCKKYDEYWNWVKNRNENRFKTNIDHNKNYDSKNMSHCFRLIDEAEEIGISQTLTLKSKNRDFLMKVKNGDFEYDYLIELAQKKLNEIDKIYKESNLPDSLDQTITENILVELRDRFYNS